MVDHPYAMLIETPDGEQFCGGTLVAPTKVLTAAHCIKDAAVPLDLLVIGGRTDMGSTKGTVRHVASVKVHPKFVQSTLTYDAAVITRSSSMPYARFRWRARRTRPCTPSVAPGRGADRPWRTRMKAGDQ
ncbi:trypsin-like serine protease [Streptomyces sp. NPDC014724]|uniref:trypsin-like serine protease n=1 Tax=unclassified Streptomyces TaxID=2593676 RepID=UPI0036FC8389